MKRSKLRKYQRIVLTLGGIVWGFLIWAIVDVIRWLLFNKPYSFNGLIGLGAIVLFVVILSVREFYSYKRDNLI